MTNQLPQASEMVSHVAKLARLNLSQAELDRFGKDMGNILSLVDQLSGLSLENSPENNSPQSQQSTVLREDVVVAQVDLEKLLQNAPLREDDFFRVPKIMSDN